MTRAEIEEAIAYNIANCELIRGDVHALTSASADTDSGRYVRNMLYERIVELSEDIKRFNDRGLNIYVGCLQHACHAMSKTATTGAECARDVIESAGRLLTFYAGMKFAISQIED